jgi:hypothetical protein
MPTPLLWCPYRELVDQGRSIDALDAFVTDWDNVTFPELEHEFVHRAMPQICTEGDFSLYIGNNIYLWECMSKDLADMVVSALRSGKVSLCVAGHYFSPGRIGFCRNRLPRAGKRDHPYKNPHHLGVVFRRASGVRRSGEYVIDPRQISIVRDSSRRPFPRQEGSK